METCIRPCLCRGLLLAVFCLSLLSGPKALGASHASAAPHPNSAKPWVIFDLGENSLLYTPKDPETGDIVTVSWIRFAGDDGKTADAHAYLTDLRAHGYPIGLLVNIPEDWGDRRLEFANAWLAEADLAKKKERALSLRAAKVEAIKDYFEGHGPGDAPRKQPRWKDSICPSMDFEIFNRDAVLTPSFKRYRKPMYGPVQSFDPLFLYRQALELASHCCSDPSKPRSARRPTTRPILEPQVRPGARPAPRPGPVQAGRTASR